LPKCATDDDDDGRGDGGHGDGRGGDGHDGGRGDGHDGHRGDGHRDEGVGLGTSATLVVAVWTLERKLTGGVGSGTYAHARNTTLDRGDLHHLRRHSDLRRVAMCHDGGLRRVHNRVETSESYRDLWCRVCDRAPGDRTHGYRSGVASLLNRNQWLIRKVVQFTYHFTFVVVV